ncbi:Vacuole membrane protein 1 [Anabarilius grahami]|uniref:Vacuole membrane protein 1 n=1 Tax=Anabarilius grahami TaxID=495550 RepID=A0A3N0Z7W0_ANAGA|nr:Vacuole membrane protein 1 [Anabarilius grahami]
MKGAELMLHIYTHTRVPVCSKGVGTVIGEAPEFFTARAAELSGTGPCDEACEEFAEMFHSAMLRAVSPELVICWSMLVLSWSYAGPMLVLSWSYAGPMLVLSWSYAGPMLVLS